MNIVARLEQWKLHGVISAEQHTVLTGLSRGEPFSVFLELNIALYAGVLAFIGGLGWTVTTWSAQLGDALVISLLAGLFGVCLWYCFAHAPRWSTAKTIPPNLVFDYILYLGSLVWTLLLGYLETRFHLLGAQPDLYLLATAGLFFLLAYRLDNRFVLSLALSSLAGWFGLTVSRWPSHQDTEYRGYAVLYSLLTGGAGLALFQARVKPHFLGTYLHLAANVFFCAALSGVFEDDVYGRWFLYLAAACAASLAWGLSRRQGAFVAYAAVYGYIGISTVLLRSSALSGEGVLLYFIVTSLAMIALLIHIARRFRRSH
jgi:hypothetical protein